MGLSPFLDALSKIGLIKVNVDKSTKIILNDKSNISVVNSKSKQNQNISDPKEVEEFVFQLTEILKKYKQEESLPCQIIHKDLLKDYSQYQEVAELNSKNLSLLKDVLPLEEIECIIAARRIQQAYQRKDASLVKILYKQLEKNYPKKGRKVANLIKAGYFDELIVPVVEICKTNYPKDYREKFRDFYSDLLAFFPTAIFVNNETNEDNIEREISKRLRLKTIPMIRIHSIGKDNIKKVEKVVNRMKEEGKIRFNLEDKRFFTPSGIEAQNLEIKIRRNYF